MTDENRSGATAIEASPSTSSAASPPAMTVFGRAALHAANSSIGATLIAIAAGMAIWQLLITFVDQPLIAPGVGIIGASFLEALLDGTLFENAWASLYRVFVGFFIATVLAIPIGFMLGWYPAVRRYCEPYVQFMRVIPPIALIPLLIIYLGIGESARIFVIALAAFLAIVVAVYQGVWEVDPVLVRAARVLGAKEHNIFAEVVVPATFPYILVGMRQGLANAWGSLVAAELIASSKGPGLPHPVEPGELPRARHHRRHPRHRHHRRRDGPCAAGRAGLPDAVEGVTPA